MKKQLLLLGSVLMTQLSMAQTIDFESAGLQIDTFQNQTDSADSAFVFENFVFPNHYDTAFGGYWDGWSISTMRDDSTAGYANEYSAIAGGGKSSDTYMVGYPSYSEGLYIEAKPYLDTRLKFESIQVCNNAYAYYSMLNGDGFAKKFGGSSGDDPDYLILHIMLELDDQIFDTIDFYLADYTSSDSSEDYIVDEWTEVDLSSFDTASYYFKLRFGFSSSDTAFGFINTPTYVCLDDLKYSLLTGTEDVQGHVQPSVKWNIDGSFEITATETGTWKVYDIGGKLIGNGTLQPGLVRNRIEAPAGIYVMELETRTGKSADKVWKN